MGTTPTASLRIPDGRPVAAALTGAALACAAALAVAGAGQAAAQGPPGVEDQRNTPPGSTTYGCGSSGLSLFQGFTPRGGDVVAVELGLRAGGGFPAAGTKLTLSLRDGGPSGALIGTATAEVAGPLAPGASIAPRFVFQPPARVQAGAPATIELHSPAPEGTPAAAVASWFGTDGDPYPRGQAFGCTGGPVPDRDQHFVTFTSSLEPPTDEPVRAAPTATPSRPVCRQILDLVPAADIDAALAQPAAVFGYDLLDDPSKPEGPFNRRRRWLTLRALSVPYHALHNGLVFRSGCP